MATPVATTTSTWASLRHPVYRAVWIATIVSNVGTWMQDVGNAWLMTSLSPSPLMVSLVQTAGSLPLFLFALPAGALADVMDRRRVLIVSQIWMLLAAVGIGVITLVGLTQPWMLLLFAALLGTGAALAAPAFQSIVPELVPPEDLPGAVGLNALAVNISRSIGPAIGGLVVAAAGPGVAYLLNGVSFAFVATVFVRWKRQYRPSALPAERMISGMRAGVRFVIHDAPLRAVLTRNFAFMIAASGLWSLAPVVVRGEMHLGPAPYGLLLGCMGAGAMTAINLLPRVRRRVSSDWLVVLASILFAIATFALSLVRQPWLLAPFLFVGGIGWVTALGTLNVAAQKAVPGWVRSRALASYLVVWFGSMAIGGVIWGLIASRFGATAALVASGVVMLAGMPVMLRYRLSSVADLDLTPSGHWAAPVLVGSVEHDRGPVLVQIEYHVAADQARPFVAAMRELRGERLRDGAFSWALYSDAADPCTYVETFAVESWLEHLRQHERVTATDQRAQLTVRQFLVGEASPRVRHLISDQ